MKTIELTTIGGEVITIDNVEDIQIDNETKEVQYRGTRSGMNVVGYFKYSDFLIFQTIINN